MDPIIFTPRLKLTLIKKAERGSPELEWLHEVRSNEKATWWSIHGQQKTLEDTEKVIAGFLPVPLPAPLPTDNPQNPDTSDAEDEKTYRVVYAVHQLPRSPDPPLVGEQTDQPATTTNTTTTPTTVDQSQSQSHPQSQSQNPTTATTFIGLVTLTSLNANTLDLPTHLTTLPTTTTTSTTSTTTTSATTTKPLTVELAYMFLPTSWGQGYATESVNAVFSSCQRAGAPGSRSLSFWSPFSSVTVRAIVNQGNPASMRVMHKTGMTKTGVYELTGRRVFLAGEWREHHSLHIFIRRLF